MNYNSSLTGEQIEAVLTGVRNTDGIIKSIGDGKFTAAVSGQDFEAPLIIGYAVPSRSTEGVPGQLYYSTYAKAVYICTDSDVAGSTWVKAVADGTNFRILGYVSSVSSLPSSPAVGDAYGVGSTASGYDIYVYGILNGKYTWVNNGKITALTAQNISYDSSFSYSEKTIGKAMKETNTSLSSEIASRTTLTTSLQKQLTSETSQRTSTDEALQSSIEAETKERKSQDTALSATIGVLSSLTTAVKTCIVSAVNELNSIKENLANKVVSLSAASTDVQYPSAKCVYDHIKKGLPIDKVWVNPAPTEKFAAQTIELDLSNYDAVYIRMKTIYNAEFYGGGIAFKDGLVHSISVKNTTAATLYSRSFTVTDTGIDCTTGYSGTSASINYGIPYAIYGIKLYTE